MLEGAVFHARRVLNGVLVLQRRVAEYLVGLIAGGRLIEKPHAAFEGPLAAEIEPAGQSGRDVELGCLREIVAANAGKHEPVLERPQLKFREEAEDPQVLPVDLFV